MVKVEVAASKTTAICGKDTVYGNLYRDYTTGYIYG